VLTLRVSLDVAVNTNVSPGAARVNWVDPGHRVPAIRCAILPGSANCGAPEDHPPPALARCRDLHHPRGHSTDSATPGSTRAARRAGTQHASVATAPSTSGTATNVARSVGGTP
jgi:hypothetical protein